MNYQLAIATDLDGTLLEGNNKAKSFFYNELVRLRDEILLIYVTGRSVNAVEYFCRKGYLPFPHYVIADHGSHVVDGTCFNPLDALQNPIVETWGNQNHYLRNLLKDEIGIQLQPINPPYRVAYYYDPSLLQETTLEKITQAGCDYILSCDLYLDILPKGINKGSTLLNLLNYLNIHQENVVTSGDSLNDLPLFQTGLKSIAVANSEPKLIHAIKNLNNVFLSPSPGLLGIIDGLKFYQMYHHFQELSYS